MWATILLFLKSNFTVSILKYFAENDQYFNIDIDCAALTVELVAFVPAWDDTGSVPVLVLTELSSQKRTRKRPVLQLHQGISRHQRLMVQAGNTSRGSYTEIKPCVLTTRQRKISSSGNYCPTYLGWLISHFPDQWFTLAGSQNKESDIGLALPQTHTATSMLPLLLIFLVSISFYKIYWTITKRVRH